MVTANAICMFISVFCAQLVKMAGKLSKAILIILVGWILYSRPLLLTTIANAIGRQSECKLQTRLPLSKR